MRRRTSVAVLAALCGVLGAVRAEAGAAEDFVDCAPGFFDVLKAERGGFGEVSLVKTANEERGAPRTGGEATFAKPQRAFGLRLVGYRQTTVAWPNLTTWSWGFVVAAKPRKVAFAIDPVIRKEGVSEEGFKRDSDKLWRASVGAPKSGRWRELRVFALEDGRSLLSCGAMQGVYEGFPGLPDIEDLFGVRASPAK